MANQEDKTELMLMFRLGIKIKQVLLKKILEDRSITIQRLVSENVETVEKIARLHDFQSCNRSLSDVQPEDLGIPSLDFIYNMFCGDFFWNTCLNGETLTRFLNENKHQIFHLYQSKNFCCIRNCQSYLKPNVAISKEEWVFLFKNSTNSDNEHTDCSGVCLRAATNGINISDLHIDLSRRVLRVVSPLFHSVECIANYHRTIYGCPIDINVSNEEYANMKNSVNIIAKFCNIEEEVSTKMEEFRRLTLQSMDLAKIRKDILRNSLAHPNVLQDNTLYSKVQDELSYIERRPTEEVVAEKLLCMKFSLKMTNGKYTKGDIKQSAENTDSIKTKDEAKAIQIDSKLVDEENADKEKLSETLKRKCCFEKNNYIKLRDLVQNYGKKAFIDILLKRLHGVSSYGSFLSGMKDRLTVHLDQHEKDILYPNTGIYKGDLTDLDISILYKIVRNLNTIAPPEKGWGKDPGPNERNIGACLERIRIAKNSIVSHHRHCRVPDKEFGVMWKELKQDIVAVSDGQFDNDIDKLLASPIDSLMEENLISAIKEQTHSNEMKDVYTCGNCHGTTYNLGEFSMPVYLPCELRRESATGENNVLVMHIECDGISPSEINEKRHLTEFDEMKIAKAEEGSIILWLHVCTSSLTSLETFYDKTEEFLERFFGCFVMSGEHEYVNLEMKLVNTAGCSYKEDVYLCGECSEEFATFNTYIVHKAKQHIQMSEKTMADAQFLREEGNKNFKAGDIESALAYYTQALELGSLKDADKAVIFKNRAACHLKKDKFKDAVKDASSLFFKSTMGDASRYNLRSSPRGPIHPTKSPHHHGSASKLNDTGDNSNLSGNESLSEQDMSVEEYNNSARSTSATPKKRGKEKTGEKKSATPQKKLTKTDFTNSPKSTTPQKQLTKTEVTDSSKSANSVNTEKRSSNLLVLFVALLVVVVGTAYYWHIVNTDNKPIVPVNPNLLQVFNNEMSHIQSQYPTQSVKFWKTVKISLKRIIKEANPHYPAIVMIVVPSGSKASETGSCIAKLLTKIINTLFNVTSAKVINIPSDIRHLDPDTEKKDLDVKIKESFENEHIRSIAVDHLEQLMPRASLLFHGYCDGDNAPFKDRAILFVLHTNLDKEALLNDNSLIDKYLMELWSSTDYPLDRDKIDPLIARVANNAVVISEEENLKCN